MTLSCPYCKAKPDRECSTKAGGFAAVHVQRIVAAAKDTKRKREDFSQAAARIVREASED